MYSNLTIIIPTRDEKMNIGVLLGELSMRYKDARIVVVDEASTDGTQEQVRAFQASHPNVRLIERPDESLRGITVSVLSAVKQVESDYFAVIDGDLQHPSESIGRLHAELIGGSVIAIGARLPYDRKQLLHRYLITVFATYCAHLRLYFRGIRVADPMSGLFATRTKIIQNLVREKESRFELRGYKVLFDILRLGDSSWKITEVFYEFEVREDGLSKLRPIHAFYFLRSLFR